MKKKQLGVILLAVVLSSSMLPAIASAFSLIVAPARFSVLQVLFDVIDKRSAVLVSYQGEAGTENPALHVWSGAAWNPLSLHEFQELSFLQSTPDRVVMIGDDALLPYAVRDRLSWVPELVRVRDLSNASLINELGQVLTWSDYEWRWFAGRYKLDLEDTVADKRKQSWYDQPGPIARDDKSPITAGRDPRYIEPAPVTTRVMEQPVEVEPEVIAIPEPPALESAPVIDEPAETKVNEVEAPAVLEPDSVTQSVDAPLPEASENRAKSYSLNDLIQDLQAPAPAPAIEEPVQAK